jgi:hypothetical protein
MTSSDLYERIHGAWLARTGGAVLGKPLQMGWSKSKVVQYLHQANCYPCEIMCPGWCLLPAGLEFKPERKAASWVKSTAPHTMTIPTIPSCLWLLLEKYGIGFQTIDVATEWLRRSHLLHLYL